MLLVFEQQRPQHNSKKDNHTNVLNEEQSIIEHWKNNKSIMRPKSCQSESDLFHAYMLILAMEKINNSYAYYQRSLLLRQSTFRFKNFLFGLMFKFRYIALNMVLQVSTNILKRLMFCKQKTKFSFSFSHDIRNSTCSIILGVLIYVL